MDPLMDLALLVQHGENREAVLCAEKLLAESYTVEQVVEAVAKGVAILRNKCTIENFQLLDVLLACRAMTEVVDECVAIKLKQRMDGAAGDYERAAGAPPRKTIVIGTIQGDVHDLGKHVMATLCRFNNLKVVNLGKDVPVENFIVAARKEKADFVGVSSLMSVCLPKIKMIKPALAAQGLEHVKVIGGGSAVQQSSAEMLRLDYLAFDAFDGLDYLCKTV
ncbi:MAG: cobalamin B12-binding domain-containing protein [Nitrospinae bacterium]|nr:cobalamin B12-binding domain-containing protein [Nitrospinota bacterium]